MRCKKIVATGKDIIDIAERAIGAPYKFGVVVDYYSPDSVNGPFDCAEFVTWAITQAVGHTHGTINVRVGKDGRIIENAWTEAWYDEGVKDHEHYTISTDEQGDEHNHLLYMALLRPGVVLLRRQRTVGLGRRRRKIPGHVALSIGDGKNVIEARRGGVGVRSALNRVWDLTIWLGCVDYGR
ncbi:hypothetical protein D6779_11010 [Candidatus Parcubacteria bacterium]|nr:MAG: hypothetical protein CUN57_00035 [Phototrophicales bacterium]RME56152.1 MAG: hypothetical protein D6779_11010 [Candidatus Parcubacteria bacterium]